jgi:hypothetical protein
MTLHPYHWVTGRPVAGDIAGGMFSDADCAKARPAPAASAMQITIERGKDDMAAAPCDNRSSECRLVTAEDQSVSESVGIANRDIAIARRVR